jgi:multiple sugar transport system substrate-binding protein
MNKKLHLVIRACILAVFAVSMASCTSESSVSPEPAETVVQEETSMETEASVESSNESKEVSLWFHGGSVGESETLRQQVEDFNNSQTDYVVTINELPGGSGAGSNYNDAVNAAALAGDLPDLLDFDGPFLFNYAWGGYLTTLDDLLSEEMKQDVFPSVLGSLKYNGKIYGIGQYDSGLALVGNKTLLEEAGVRIPKSVDDAWTFEEFNDVLERVKGVGETEYSIDLKMNYGAGEWYTYAFTPIVWGFGGDLIDRSTYETAEGFINGKETVEAITWFKSLFDNGYAITTPPDDNEFINGKAALGWVGHWMTTGYYEALGEDFVLIPFPNFGVRQATCNGTWFWGITKDSKNPEGAMAFLEFLMSPEEVLRTVNQNGAVPATYSAIKQSDLFKEGGRLSVFAEQLAREDIATARPITPAYPVITSAFYTAIDNIIKGADVQAELDAAADKIDKDLRDNDFYPQK